MNWVYRLAQSVFRVVAGELWVGGLPVSELAARFGTPLFVYDACVLDRQLEALRAALPPGFEVYYSIKANPNPWILRHFLARACGLEVASAGEYHLARVAGCSPSRILFAGPGKTQAELELVLKEGLEELHVESCTEIDRLAALADRSANSVAVALRVNPRSDTTGGGLQMGGKPAPFGVDEEDLNEAVARVLGHPRLQLTGLHLFTGTQILDVPVLIRQYRSGVAIARWLARRLGHPLRTLDLGGGLGIPYTESDRPLDLAKLREELSGLASELAGDRMFRGTRFILEPGRFLVGPAGVYIARVTEVKVSRGKTFVIADGGMNHHLAASGQLGQVLRRNFPVAILTKLDRSPEATVDVVGPLCTPLDVLARRLETPRPEPGDLVGVLQSGAYTRAASPLSFLSHPSPPEVLVHHGTAQLIRRRGTPDDLVRDILELPT